MRHIPMHPDVKVVMHAARERFILDHDGIHGMAHWGRVRTNGLRLAQTTGALREVVELFALLHDSCREDDGLDHDHGTRAAEFAEYLASRNILKIGTAEMELLTTACRLHSDGLIPEDATLSTCWDADRLDLGRIHIRPDPYRLCTEAARDPRTIDWAWRRSRAWLRNSGSDPLQF